MNLSVMKVTGSAATKTESHDTSRDIMDVIANGMKTAHIERSKCYILVLTET